MDNRDEHRDDTADLKLGTVRQRNQPSRKRGSTFSVTFALTDVEDRLVESLAERTGSRSRSAEVRLAIHERAQRVLSDQTPQ